MRPRYVAIIFLLCFAVVLAAMGWMSATVLRLHKSEVAAEQRADLEERVRLALWRMDSTMSALIARENGRPYFAYTAFYPIERAYSSSLAPIEYGEVLSPSPVLIDESPQILLYFEFDPAGELASPQVPTGEMREQAKSHFGSDEKIRAANERLQQFRTLDVRETLLAALPKEPSAPGPPRVSVTPQQRGYQRSKNPYAQKALNAVERSFRQQQQSQAAHQQIMDNQAAAPLPNVVGGAMTPVWRQETLMLARRLQVDNEEFVQGCQLDWPAISTDLLTRVGDLLPDARLEPVLVGDNVEEARQLATLPVRLLPGALPAVGDGVSPLVFSLILAWICFVLAGIAIAVLLAGALSLSERRGAFVSAVTHELRTPLTAFRLYTDLLADQSDIEPSKRTRYVDTLRHEAGRLQHLVENVLAYARLERGRGAALEDIQVGALIDRIRDPIGQRVAQAGTDLTIEIDESARSVTTRVDPSAVERILLNLTDNACKYACRTTHDVAAGPRTGREGEAPAEPHAPAAPSLNITITQTNNQIVVRVRDNGPGVPPQEINRLFRPFHKSATDAAHSAPGVGLGLSLSRKLARDMNGDLTLDRSFTDGACFVLTLPKTTAG